MVIDEVHKLNSKNTNHQMDNEMYNKVGCTVKLALLKAQAESRVIVGLPDIINELNCTPEGSLFCLLAEPQAGDSATHMHEVLLEAFCYENDIYVIKVDSAKKLSRILGADKIESCALVQRQLTSDAKEFQNCFENSLIDHCEAYWDAPQQPIIKLPAM